MVDKLIRRARATVNAIQKRLASKGVILMYHRIAEASCNPWGICVSPDNFAEHLQVLKQSFTLMRLQELAKAQQRGNIPHGAVAITFDDGYVDNLMNAKSVLEQYDIPATVFLTSGYIGSNREFWWDELEKIFLSPGKLPKNLTLRADNRMHSWDLSQVSDYTTADYERECTVSVWQSSGVSRRSIYYSVWKTLQPLPREERESALQSILQWSNIDSSVRPDFRPMHWEEVRKLIHEGLIEVGAHTVHHPFLPALPRDNQWKEISKSKSDIEKMLGIPVNTFAYPFGAYNKQTVSLVKDTGFACACTTTRGPVWRKCDKHELPRFSVHDCNGEEFNRKLREWFQS